MTFLVIGIALVVGSYLNLRLVIFPSFQELEDQEGQKDMYRAEQGLEFKLEHLAVINHEYAIWDDTYFAMLDPASIPDYIEENLVTSGWQDLNVDGMLIFDQQGTYMGGHLLDPVHRKDLSVKEAILTSLSKDHPVVTDNR